MGVNKLEKAPLERTSIVLPRGGLGTGLGLGPGQDRGDRSGNSAHSSHRNIHRRSHSHDIAVVDSPGPGDGQGEGEGEPRRRHSHSLPHVHGIVNPEHPPPHDPHTDPTATVEREAGTGTGAGAGAGAAAGAAKDEPWRPAEPAPTLVLPDEMVEDFDLPHGPITPAVARVVFAVMKQGARGGPVDAHLQEGGQGWRAWM